MVSAEVGAERRVILGLLIQQESVYQHLLQLTEAEHEAILGGTPEELMAIVDQKERLIERLALLEAERIASVGRVAEGLGRHGNDVTLAALRDAWDAEELEQVTSVQARLMASVNRISELNRNNAKLLRSSLLMLNRWMDLIAGVQQATETYSKTGKQRGRAAATRVNRKV